MDKAAKNITDQSKWMLSDRALKLRTNPIEIMDLVIAIDSLMVTIRNTFLSS